MLLKCFYVCLICLIGKLNAFDASFIKPCKPNDNECNLKSGQDALKHIVGGIPELGIASLDPLAIDSIKSDSPNLNLVFRNLQIHGFSNCKLTELSRNLDKNIIKLTAECPLTGKGQYDVNGKLLVLEVVGDGDFEIICKKFKLTLDMNVKDIVKDGRKYWKLTSFDYSYDILDKVHFKFDNLFGGDEKLAKPVLEALETNSKEIIDEIGGSMIKKVLAMNVEIIRKFLLAIPVEQLQIA